MKPKDARHILTRAKRPAFIATVTAIVAALFIGLFVSPARAAISFRSASTGNNAGGATTLSIGVPSGVQANDVMIAVIGVRGGTGTTVTSSVGWTLINSNVSTTTLKSLTYYRVATGSESTYSFGFSSSQKASGVIGAYSGVDTLNPIAAQDKQVNGSNATMTSPSITTTDPNSWIIAAFSNARSGTFTAGSGMTLRGQASSTADTATTRTTSGLQDVTQAVAGSTGTKTMTSANAAVSVGHTIALKPLGSNLTQDTYRWFENDDTYGGGGDWWNSSWTSRRKITFDNSASSENLTNFPIRVSLSAGNIDYFKTQNTGQDIRFVDSDGTTVLSHEIETWNESGASEVWVKVPQIDASSTTDYIYMYYDNPVASDGQNVSDVWSNGYRGVWHTKESSGTSVADSSGNSNTGSLQNGATITTSGKIGNANSFDGTNDIMNAGSSASLDNLYAQGNNGMTVSAWAHTVDSNQWSIVGMKGANASPSNTWLLELDDSGNRVHAAFTGNSNSTNIDRTSSGLISYGSWQYYTMTYNHSNSPHVGSDINLYVNGQANQLGASGSLSTIDSDASYDFTSGCDLPLNANECLQGTIDELRVSNVARSGEWVEAEYISTNNAMNTFSSEEAYTPVTGLTALATQNDPASRAVATAFRLRQIVLENGALETSNTVKLQYAEKTGSCSVSSFSDVGASGAIAYYDNPSLTDDNLIVADPIDPTPSSGSLILQTYQEANPVNVTNSVAAGQNGMWDFALTSEAAAAGKTYCFRLVYGDGSAFGTYSYYPEMTILGSGPTLDQQLRGGQSVVNGIKTPLVF